MQANPQASRTGTKKQRTWIRYVLIALIVEKIIQHIAVTLGFYIDWRGIRSTVAVNPDVLMVLGAVVAVLFVASLWGFLTRRTWATNIVIGLAVFDMVGEFVAQGRLGIELNVSFLVATLLLILGLLYRRDEMRMA